MLIDINDIKGILYLGVQGEHQVIDVDINCASWLEEYPEGLLAIEAQRPKENTVYVADTSTNGNILTWHVKTYDTYVAGNGTYQVKLNNAAGENIKISPILRTMIKPSQKGSLIPQPPIPTPSWIDDVMTAATEAKQSAKDIEDLTVSSHVLPPGSTPTVTKTKPTGEPYNLDFGIPTYSVESIVTSVNGKKGDVVIGPDDIGLKEALEAGSFKIPTRALEIQEGDTLILYGGKAEL